MPQFGAPFLQACLLVTIKQPNLDFGFPKKQYLGRYEENAYLMRMLKLSGHKEVEHLEFDGYGHGISIPAMPVLLRKVNQLTERIKSSY